MKKFFLSLSVFFLVVVSSGTLFAQSFPDIAGHRYEEAIEFLADRGIVNGHADGMFRPDDFVNRAEIIKIVMEANGYTVELAGESLENPFSGPLGCFPDVSGNDWFAPYICEAVNQDIIQGYPDGFYRPERNVNFVEALKIVQLANDFQYEADGEPWYKNSVDDASEMNIIPLDIDSFDHKMTRAQIVDLMTRVIKFKEETLEDYLGQNKDYRHTFETLSGDLSPAYVVNDLTSETEWTVEEYIAFLENLSITKIVYSDASESDKAILDETDNPDSILWKYERVALAVPPQMNDLDVRHRLYTLQNCIIEISEYLQIPFSFPELQYIYWQADEWIDQGAAINMSTENKVWTLYRSTDVSAFESFEIKIPPERDYCFDPHEVGHTFVGQMPLHSVLNEGYATGEFLLGADSVTTCLEDGYINSWADGEPIITPYADLSWQDVQLPGFDYRITAGCMWHFIDKELGHDVFLEVIAKLYSFFDPDKNWCSDETYRNEGTLSMVFLPVIGEENVNIITQRFGIAIGTDDPSCPGTLLNP